MDIDRADPWRREGPADWFTGTVWQDPIIEAEAPARLRANVVSFDPGARLDGCGRARRRGALRGGAGVCSCPTAVLLVGRTASYARTTSQPSWKCDVYDPGTCLARGKHRPSPTLPFETRGRERLN
jgi:hypothetical protein